MSSISSQTSLYPVDIGLAWGVKKSFIKYIQSSRDGQIVVAGGAGVTETDEFYFPLDKMTPYKAETQLSFNGTVRFQAHLGMLSVTVANPRLILRSDTAELAVENGEDGWTHLLHLELPPRELDKQIHMWRNIPTTLVEAGIDMFGNTYNKGQPMAPATLRIPAHNSLDDRAKV